MSKDNDAPKRVQLFSVKVQNFKRIKEATVEFRGDKIHRVSGDVNQGKTALLEAMQAAVSDFCHPSMVRLGADQASIELELDEATVTRIIPGMGEQWQDGKRKWGTIAVSEPGGMAKEDGEAFLAAVFGRFAFRPMDFVRLASGDPLHRTERERLQRNMLLNSLRVRLTKKDLQSRFKDSPAEVRTALKAMKLGTGVDFDAHGMQVCDALLEQCKEGLRKANAKAEQAQNVLATTPAPEGMIPDAMTVADCEKAVENAQEAYVAGRAQSQSAGARIERLKRLRKEVKEGAKGVHPREKVEQAAAKWRVLAADAELEVDSLQQQIEELHQKLVSAQKGLVEAQGKVAECASALRAIEAQEAREKDLAALEGEVGDGEEVVDVAGLKAAWSEAQMQLESKRRQESHDAAAEAATLAAAEAEVYEGLVKVFRDELPNEFLGVAELGLPGLRVESDRLTVDGFPLHQLGTSRLTVVAVKLWAGMYPRAPFCPIDGGESIGAEDTAAMAGVAAEQGFTLVMTVVDPQAAAGKGVTVMKDGRGVGK